MHIGEIIGPIKSVRPVSEEEMSAWLRKNFEEAERLGAEHHASRLRAYYESVFGPMEVPKRFRDLSPITLRETYGIGVTRAKEAALRAAERWASGASARPGLLLYGPPGTGKSALAWWAIQRAVYGLWVTWPDLVARSQDEMTGTNRLALSAMNAPVLLLDDFQRVYRNAWRGELEESLAFRIANARNQHELPTVITTSVCGGTKEIVRTRLEQEFSEPTAKRLWELCEFVEMGGADLRSAPRKETL